MLKRFDIRKYYYTPKGSAFLKFFQDDVTPLVDILVRETLQNSLDAFRKEEEPVRVDYQLTEIDSGSISELLSNEVEALKIPQSYKTLVLRDRNTKGLDGDATTIRSSSNVGNFQKLVYTFGEARDDAGAGGSFGLGKSILYKIGIGLVFYYSRIAIDTSDEAYEERLIAVWIENEENGKLHNQTGICLFGEVEGSECLPITDPSKIQTFCNTFQIKRLSGKETGTTMIIPGIDDAVINKSTLKTSVLRWYSPRLSRFWGDNRKRIGGKSLLEVYLQGNEKPVVVSEDQFSFLVSLLYHKALNPDDTNLGLVSSLIFGDLHQEIKLEEIFYRREKTRLGTLSWILVPESKFGSSEIYKSLKSELEEDTRLKLFLRSRMPGMIIDYDVKTLSKIDLKDFPEGTCLIAFFVLNSLGVDNSSHSNFENYFRSLEKANHKAWEDKKDSPRKYSRHIDKEVRSKISTRLNALAPERVEGSPERKLGEKLFHALNLKQLSKDKIGKAPWERRMSKARPQASFEIISVIREAVRPFEIDSKIECSLKGKQKGIIQFEIAGGDKEISYADWRENFPNKLYPIKIKSPKLKKSKEIEGQLEAKLYENKIELSNNSNDTFDRIVISATLEIADAGYTITIRKGDQKG